MAPNILKTSRNLATEVLITIKNNNRDGGLSIRRTQHNFHNSLRNIGEIYSYNSDPILKQVVDWVMGKDDKNFILGSDRFAILVEDYLEFTEQFVRDDPITVTTTSLENPMAEFL